MVIFFLYYIRKCNADRRFQKLSDFCEMNKFKNLILRSTCFKGLLPSTMDLLSTNHKQSLLK